MSSTKRYFNVEVRRTRYEFTTLRVPINFTADMTVQGGKNIAGAMACDHLRGTVSLAGVSPHIIWTCGDEPDLGSHTVHKVEESPRSMLPERAILIVIDELRDMLVPYFKAGNDWDSIVGWKQNYVHETVIWLQENSDACVHHTIDPLSRLSDLLDAIKAPEWMQETVIWLQENSGEWNK